MVPLLPRALGDRAGAGWSGRAIAVPDHLSPEHAARDRGRTGRVHEDAAGVLAQSAAAQVVPQEDRDDDRLTRRVGQVARRAGTRQAAATRLQPSVSSPMLGNPPVASSSPPTELPIAPPRLMQVWFSEVVVARPAGEPSTSSVL